MNKQKTFLLVLILCLVIFAACFRLYGLTFQSLWLDELLSVNHSAPSDGIYEPFHYTRYKTGSPPLFYVSLWIWRVAFGTGEFPARLFPAILGIFGVLSMFFLGKELFSIKTGIYASLLTAVLPFHIYYSQEVRPYSLLFLLCVLSYFFLLKFVKQKSIRWGLLYVLVTSCMLYTHYFSFFVLLAQLVYLAVVFLSDRKLDRMSFIKSYLPIGILLALSYLPWMNRVRRLMKVKKIWADIPQPDFFVSYFKGYFGNELYVVLICVSLLGLYLLHKSKKDEFPFHKVLLFFWIFCVFTVTYLRSLTHAALLTPRNTIVVLPAIILMICMGLERLKSNKVQIIVFGSILCMLFMNIFYTNGNYYKTVTKEQWREAAKYVLVKDPEGKYPVFVDGRIGYYFYDVFKSDRRLWPKIQTQSHAERAIKFVSEQKFYGFWVIQAHQRLDKEVQEYLETQYSVKIRKPLKGAWVTFYERRDR